MRVFINRYIAGCVVLILALLVPAYAMAQAEDPIPVIDWQKRETSQERLTAFGDDLMGDSIDPHIGSIVFDHTDVSLPGNFKLDVSIRRRLVQGYKYDEGVNVEFGDWELVVPKITVISAAGWVGNRCSGDWAENFPKVGGFSYQTYSSGVNMTLPGQRTQRILKNINANPGDPRFPAGHEAFTTYEWYFTCITANDGKQGFLGHAPNGDKYYFKEFISRPYKRMGFANTNDIDLPRTKITLAATRVEDVHGNTVDYTYTNGRLTKIEASDGRKITLGYSGNLISSVSTNGRTWSYTYRNSTYDKQDWDVNNYGTFGSKVLGSVEQPDGKSWSFTLDNMQAEPHPPARNCYKASHGLNLTHPYGTTGTFSISDFGHRRSYKSYENLPRNCFEQYDNEPEPPQNFPPASDPSYITTMRAMSVTGKTLSSPDIPTMSWTFKYGSSALGEGATVDETCVPQPSNHNCNPPPTPQGGICIRISSTTCDTNPLPPDEPTCDEDECEVYGNGIQDTSPAYDYITSGFPPYYSDLAYTHAGKDPVDYANRTEVTQPDSSVITYYHLWSSEHVFGGKLVEQSVDDLQTVDTVYVAMGVGGTRPHTSRTITTRDGDIFTTEHDYVLDPSSNNYSFSFPTQTRRKSNVSTSWRTTDMTYEHLTTGGKWILGLVDTVTVNNREIADYDYDQTTGQKTSQKRYGQPFGSFTYHNDGTLHTISDALPAPDTRTATYTNWKRGIVQNIERPDLVTESQVVDDNGWVTSSTDGRGYTTTFEYDGTMGRLTEIDPPGSHYLNTDITYDFTGAGAVQTITKGSAETVVTYDAMFRPVLEKTRDTSTGWESYVNTDYDSAGRAAFTSFPSTSNSETDGTTFTYDGLGRQTGTAETVSPYATTSTDYLSGHRTEVTDAEGNVTVTHKDGFGDVIKIEQEEDTTTDIFRNAWGQIYRVRQSGTSGGYSADMSHYYYYDSRQRLCHTYTPSGGGTRYHSNAADEVVLKSSGHGHEYGCSSPGGANRVDYTYDDMGRLETVNHLHNNTPDQARFYDNDGNLLYLQRFHGGTQEYEWYEDPNFVQQAYEYDEIGNLKREDTYLDYRTFTQDHIYNPDGSLATTTRAYDRQLFNPNNALYTHRIDYIRDGLGRGTGVNFDYGSIAENAAFHPNGTLSALTYGNGLSLSQTLNVRQLLLQRTVSGSTASIQDLTYGYDKNARITSQADANGINRSYIYDGLGRLTGGFGPYNLTGAAPVAGHWNASYDSLGNMRSRQVGPRHMTYTRNSITNRLDWSNDSGATGLRHIDYDSRGNATSLGSLDMVYNASNRAVSVSDSGTGMSGAYRYDGHDRRIKSIIDSGSDVKTRYTIYDLSGALIWTVEMVQGNGAANYITQHVSLDGQTVARVKTDGGIPHSNIYDITWLHNDHLGSANAEKYQCPKGTFSLTLRAR